MEMMQYKANRNLYNNANNAKQTGIYTTMQRMQYKANWNLYNNADDAMQSKQEFIQQCR